MPAKYRFQIYKELHKNMPAIYAEAKKFADDIGITPEMKGKIGLTGAVSSCHALLTREVSQAIEDASRKVVENKFLIEEIREIVKDVYGDGFDAAPTNTCEAALWVSFDALATPPMTGRGDNVSRPLSRAVRAASASSWRLWPALPAALTKTCSPTAA